MKILKLHPIIDRPIRYNYHINYGVWDEIDGHRDILETFNGNPDHYDVVFLPYYKRLENNMALVNKLKDHKIKTVLFDNDSCYRSFDHPFYDGFDYIFYRDFDKNGKKPNTNNSSWLPWSIDCNKYIPKYGGQNILFNCSVNEFYPLRMQINKLIKHTRINGPKYIKSLQNSAAGIHTDSELVPIMRAKALEFAACGTHIISNKTKYMDYFFPNHNQVITYFNDIDHLKQIITHFKPNIEIQKELRHTVQTLHDNKIRAKQILNVIRSLGHNP